MTQKPEIGSLDGLWTYRSLLNDPDLATAFNSLEFGRGNIEIMPGPMGVFRGRIFRYRLGTRTGRLDRLRLALVGPLPGQGDRRRGAMDLRLHWLGRPALAERCRPASGHHGLGDSHDSAFGRRAGDRQPGRCRLLVLRGSDRLTCSMASAMHGASMSRLSARDRPVVRRQSLWRSNAPALEVCQIAPPAKDKPELGECVPPAISVVLRQLGLLDLFLCDGHRPTSRSLASWGSPYLASNDAIFQIDRTGWRLNRRRFDAMMRFAAGKSTPTNFRRSPHRRIGQGRFANRPFGRGHDRPPALRSMPPAVRLSSPALSGQDHSA